MTEFWEHSDAWVNLLAGGVLVIGEVAGYVKHKLETLLWLFVGAGLMAAGLLDLLGFVHGYWGIASNNAAWGIFWITLGISGLSAPPTEPPPRWSLPARSRVWWLIIAVGIIYVLLAVRIGLVAYRD